MSSSAGAGDAVPVLEFAPSAIGAHPRGDPVADVYGLHNSPEPEMIHYDADEYWHCENGFGSLTFDGRGKFFRSIRNAAFLRVFRSGMTGDEIKFWFLHDATEDSGFPWEFAVDGYIIGTEVELRDGLAEVTVDVSAVELDANGGFVLEIRNADPRAADAIFDGGESSVLRLHRVGY